MNKYFFKTAARVFVDYITTVFLFCAFLISVLLIATPETARPWLIGYSLVWFIMMMMMIYSRMKQVAQKEVIPQYDLHPYPYKGFVYGLFAMIPNLLVALLNSIVIFPKDIFNARLLVVKLIFYTACVCGNDRRHALILLLGLSNRPYNRRSRVFDGLLRNLSDGTLLG